MQKQIFKHKIYQLVKVFDRNIDDYKSKDFAFNETQLREQFINPMFESLGWDINNKQGASEQYKEVIHEDKVIIKGKPKAPDYSFRIGENRKFFLEAKQPFVKIKTGIDPAFQLRRYAWSAKLPVSILTDFEEFAVYDTIIEPKHNESASVARIEYYTYKEYPDIWEEIYDTFAREAIVNGSFDKFAKKEKRGKQVVDKAFLSVIEKWREWLAKDIAKNNSKLSIDELNQAVQKIIDRIIFLRIAEDRGIEEYKNLEKIVKAKNSYRGLTNYFQKAYKKYDSSLFDFEKDTISTRIKVTDKLLDKILENLYYPKSPYEFSVIGVEILGHIYEQFLGKVIRLTSSHNARVEYKPEVKKAGGVYYTPKYIVDYIVKNTVGELVKRKTPKEVAKLKIVDPACGSGSFLIGAYEYLLEWYLNYYQKLDEKEKKKLEKKGVIFIKECENTKDSWQLTTAEKKRIMLNNIYGVDIDSQAVEVTKLSLALKMLEDENQQTISKQMKIFTERILPDLSSNIKCGNSLIGSDYWSNMDKGIYPLENITEEEIKKVNAFDWEKEFKDIFIEKELDAYLVTWVTHNSRISERMVEYKVKKGKAVLLDSEDEVFITEKISEIIKQDNLKVLAYNICKDHVHLVIVCTRKDLTQIVQKLKSVSSREFNDKTREQARAVGTREHAPLSWALWAQKFNRKLLDGNDSLENAIDYVETNREKHGLPLNKELKSLVRNMLVTEEEAFKPQFEGGFDAVIGNPPYVSNWTLTGSNKKVIDYLNNKYNRYLIGHWDIFLCFIGLSMWILRANGKNSFILPTSVLKEKHSLKLRKFLIQNTKINEIIDFGKERIFEGVARQIMIYTLTKSFSEKHKLLLKEGIDDLGKEIIQSFYLRTRNNIIKTNVSASDVDLYKKLNSQQFIKLGNLFCINTGVVAHSRINSTVKFKKDDVIHKYERKGYKKYIIGSNMDRYYIGYKNDYIDYESKKLYFHRPKYSELFERSKIIVRRISGNNNQVIACSDREKYYSNDNLMHLVLWDDIILKHQKPENKWNIIQSDLDIDYILGLILSKLIHYYFKTFLSTDTLQGTFSSIYPEDLRDFPIVIAPKLIQNEVVSKVKEIISLQRILRLDNTSTMNKKVFIQKIEYLENTINQKVYKLYCLTEKEIKIIEMENNNG